MSELRYWQIFGTEPPAPDDKYQHRRNFMRGVVAQNVEEAIALVRENMREGVIIFSCNHHGAVHHFTQELSED